MVSKQSRKKARAERLKKVEGQTMFKDGEIVEKPRPRLVFEEYTGEVSCAYCLYTGPMMRFARTTAKGKISEKLFTCPDCGQSMRKDTLMMDAGPEQYAEWLYTQIVAYRAYSRISWEKLKQRLKEKGIANAFWTRWKQCKEQYSVESPGSFADHMMKQQEEWIKEQAEEEPKLWKPKERKGKMIDV